jgi:hypothetical protein
MVFRGALALSLGLIAACGGGGGGAEPKLEVTPANLYVPVHGDEAGAFRPLGVQITNATDGLWIGVGYTDNAINYAGFVTYAGWRVTFRPPTSLPFGVYQDYITIAVCRDSQCMDHITGSPATIAVTLDVKGVEGDATPLPFAEQHSLTHDVVNAEYSETLEAIVMTSKFPTHALYVYDTATGTEKSLALDYEPTSLALGPDGTSAAVGHNSRITVVDLAQLDDPALSPKTLLDVGLASFTASLPGNGYVYAFPYFGSPKPVRSVEIASNTETQGPGSSGPYYSMRLHPSGNKVYGLDRGSLVRYSTEAGPAQRDYQGYDHPFANYSWLDEAGERLYTDSGRVYHVSERVGRELTYAGKLELSPDPHGFLNVIRSLSDSSEHGEVALLEESPGSCDSFPGEDCFTHLGLYEGRYLELAERYSLQVYELDGQRHHQRGRFVFHSGDGANRYIVSRLEGVDPARGYLIGRVTVAGSPPPGPDPEPPPAPVINGSTEVGVPAAPIESPMALPHDVVAAEYSAALDAIVMTSSYPTKALYIYDVASGDERAISLAGMPASLALDPAGMLAAVAHDARITLIDLAPVAAAEPVVLDTTAHKPTVVLAGNGYVYAFPRTNGSYSIGKVHSIEIATNVETLSTATTYSFDDARVHPLGAKIYAVSYVGFLSLERFSTDGTAQRVYETEWSEDTCHRVWLSETGVHVYTGCGNTFQTSDDQATDGQFVGKLLIGTNPDYNTPAVWIDESAEASRIALLEAYSPLCEPGLNDAECESHLNIYASGSRGRLARYTLPALTVGAKTYRQGGLFVFHSADGAQRYVVSRLRGMPYPYAEFYISRLQQGI